LTTIGVVVVAYKSAELISACVQSCLADPNVLAVVVVDNSNQPACREVVESIRVNDSRVTYQPSDNIGFSRGCNIGAVLLPPIDVVAFINPDVELLKPLAKLAHHLNGSAAGIVSGRLVTPGSPHRSDGRAFDNARKARTAWRELLGAFIGRDRPYLVAADTSVPVVGVDDLIFSVGQVAGSLLLISSADFQTLAGYDERFELYYDDVDLCARGSELGDIQIFDEPWGIHWAGASSRSSKQMAYCAYTISRARYFRKHNGDNLGISIYLLILAWVEFCVRTVTCRGEGQRTRLKALRLQIVEVLWQGSVSVLR
jgi:N-acetylglucosaminyl-diphospho-decaprenol L-rhamnosyltransferase